MVTFAKMMTWSTSSPVDSSRTVMMRELQLGSQEWLSRWAMLPARVASTQKFSLSLRKGRHNHICKREKPMT